MPLALFVEFEWHLSLTPFIISSFVLPALCFPTFLFFSPACSSCHGNEVSVSPDPIRSFVRGASRLLCIHKSDNRPGEDDGLYFSTYNQTITLVQMFLRGCKCYLFLCCMTIHPPAIQVRVQPIRRQQMSIYCWIFFFSSSAKGNVVSSSNPTATSPTLFPARCTALKQSGAKWDGALQSYQNTFNQLCVMGFKSLPSPLKIIMWGFGCCSRTNLSDVVLELNGPEVCWENITFLWALGEKLR